MAKPISSRFVIDSIEIEGVKSFTRSEVESDLELSLIEDLDRAQVDEIGLALRDFYKFRGFNEARVRGQLIETRSSDSKQHTILKLFVDEGTPTRIQEVRLIPEQLANEALADLWKSIEPGLPARVGIVPGMIANQVKLTDSKRSIESIVSAEGFVGVRVGNIQLIPSASPQDNQSKWVDIELQVSLGDKVSFGFRGNDYLSRTDLMALIEEQRLVGFGKSYIDSIIGRFLDAYRAKGYAHAVIEAYPIEKPMKQERHVTFVIKEGARVTFDQIAFEGNEVFSDQELMSLFLERASPLVKNRVYTSSGIDEALELLVESLKSQGYLSARLIVASHRVDPVTNQATIVAYLYEGIQTRIQFVRYSGINFLSREDVLEILGLEEKAPLNLFALSEGIERLKARYRAEGFFDVKLLNEEDGTILKYTPDGLLADVEFFFTEGPQYRLDSYTIEGLSRTRTKVVEREIFLKEGDVLTQELISSTDSRLRRLGIFSTIEVKIQDSTKPGMKSVRILLQESDPGVVGGGVGFRNDLGPRVFGELSFNNLWRSNHAFTTTAAFNRRFENYRFIEYQFRAFYVWPYVFSNVQFRPEVTFDKTQYIKFDAQTLNFSSNFSKQLLPKTKLIASLTHSLERVRQFNAEENTVDNQTLTIGSLIPGISIDFRDNPLSPKKGFFSSATYELAHSSFGSQTSPFEIGFTRVQWRSDYSFKFAEYMVLFLSARTGIERNLINPIDGSGNNDKRIAIPLIKQFALGGSGSLRGWNFQELRLPEGTVLQGMASYVNYRVQFDFPISGPLTLGPFLDAANILIDRYSLGQLRYGTGAGFRYQTPVGPVNFDWGFKIQPRPGEETNRFYFSIGVL